MLLGSKLRMSSSPCAFRAWTCSGPVNPSTTRNPASTDFGETPTPASVCTGNNAPGVHYLVPERPLPVQGTELHCSAAVPSCTLSEADWVAPCVAEILRASMCCVDLAAELAAYSQDASPSEWQCLLTSAHIRGTPSKHKENTDF